MQKNVNGTFVRKMAFEQMEMFKKEKCFSLSKNLQCFFRVTENLENTSTCLYVRLDILKGTSRKLCYCIIN